MPSGRFPGCGRDELERIDAYWRAANYLCVGQIYLLDNPLLREPLRPEHVKPRLLGHLGTTPGLNLVYAHLNRVIRARDLDAHLHRGPGHGGPGLRRERLSRGHLQRGLPGDHARRRGMRAALPPVQLPGRHPEPRRAGDAGLDPRGRRAGLRAVARLRRRLRQPGPAGRLRRSATARRRPGRSRRAGTRTSSSTRTRRRGPADPAPQRLQDRQPHDPRPHPGATSCRAARGLRPYASIRRRGRRPGRSSIGRWRRRSIGSSTRSRRSRRAARHRRWRPRPAALADDRAAHAEGLDRPEGGRRQAGRRTPGAAHQVPMADVRDNPAHLALLEAWLRSYRPDELFDEHGTLRPELAALAPGRRSADERQPACQRRACCCATCASRTSATTRSTSTAPAIDLVRGDPGPGRRSCATSIRLNPAHVPALRARTRRPPTGSRPSSRRPIKAWSAETLPTDEHLAPDGRVIEVLSEHICQGWLEGYLLTGRHGLFNCYEAFIHIVDSMFNQHAKWLKMTREIPWRRPIASLNYLLTQPRLAPGPQRLQPPGPGLHRPRRQQEGRGHPRLPAAGREHPAVGRRPLPAQPQLRQRHRRRQAAGARTGSRWTTRPPLRPAAIGIWEWASNDGGEPDVVMACCGRRPHARDRSPRPTSCASTCRT